MATEDSLSPSVFLYPDWQNEYAAALLETNPQELSQRVEPRRKEALADD